MPDSDPEPLREMSGTLITNSSIIIELFPEKKLLTVEPTTTKFVNLRLRSFKSNN